MTNPFISARDAQIRERIAALRERGYDSGGRPIGAGAVEGGESDDRRLARLCGNRDEARERRGEMN